MQVLILAGGLGTRLRSMVQDVPKPMASVRGRPFLEYILSFWEKMGATHFYLSIGHLAEKIESHFKDEYQGIPITRIIESEPLGTGGGLLYAIEHVKLDEDLVVVNGDTYFDVDFEGMHTLHQRQDSKLTIGLREVTSNDRYSGVVLNEEGQITQFAERNVNSEHLLINAGVYLLKPTFLTQFGFAKGKKLSLEDEIFPKLIESDKIYGFVSSGRFIDIGVPKDYLRAQEFFVV